MFALRPRLTTYTLSHIVRKDRTCACMDYGPRTTEEGTGLTKIELSLQWPNCLCLSLSKPLKALTPNIHEVPFRFMPALHVS